MDNKDEIINDIQNNVNQMVNSFNLNIESSNNAKDLRRFYIENLNNNEFVEKEIINRDKFVEEYPVERILNFTIEDYCLGLKNNKDTFCYKLEFGKYKDTGFGIGGGTSGKCGFYYDKDGNFKGKNNEVITDVDSYWSEFKKQLYGFLKEMENSEPNFVLDAKYPLLGGSGSYMFLTKLLCLYYPDKYISMSKDDVYQKLGKYFNVKFDKKAVANSYYANRAFRDFIPEANEHHGFYIANAIWKFFGMDKEENIINASVNNNNNNNIRVEGGENIIYYGVPGTGKSYKIKEEIEEISETNKFRVTFHPEFTYNDFIGQLLPCIDKETKSITYDFKMGQFTEALKKAYENPEEKIYLIIEELSRGNCAAIFGDIFQLLDRNQDGEEKGWSMYSINNELIASQIDSRFTLNNSIRIPSNMYIYGTVNTSDQNVFVMDNAFKRRFDWRYVSTNPKEIDGQYLNNIEIRIYESAESWFDTNWINLYQMLNLYISSSQYLDLGEDKQIGQFFIQFTNNTEKDYSKIRDKLLHYLWFDVQNASYKNECKLFDSNISNFSTLYDAFDNKEKVFSDEFISILKKSM